jgi:hypothetical protein
MSALIGILSAAAGVVFSIAVTLAWTLVNRYRKKHEDPNLGHVNNHTYAKPSTPALPISTPPPVVNIV